MNHPTKTARGAVRRARAFSFITISALTCCLPTLQAQNTSSNADAIPLAGGAFNAGFGIGVLVPSTGNDNTAIGYRSMTANTTGSDNACLGYFTLAANTTGGGNTAIGTQAMELGQNPTQNTAVGMQSLRNVSAATQNTAVGYQSMTATTTGGRNAAVGFRALATNTIGSSNAAFGTFALTTNSTGNGNTAIGRDALSASTTASSNTAVGFGALSVTTTGGGNCAVGSNALNVNTTGTANSAIGISSNVSAANLINGTAIGSNAIVNASNKVRLGSAAVTVVEGPVAYTVSDGRFKTNVRAEDVVGLAFIQRLRPVVYNFDTRGLTAHWTQNMDAKLRDAYLAQDFSASTAIRQSGFIAQEVEEAAKATGYDFNGVHAPVDAADNYSLAYGQFVVPLVKAVQEQQAQIDAQAAQARQQEAQIATQQAQIAELQAQVRQLLAAGGAGADTRVGNAGLEVFPNPSHGRFTLRIAPLEQGQWEVYDQQGRLVQRQAIQPGQADHTLDLSGMAAGSYQLRILSGKGLVATQQLVVK